MGNNQARAPYDGASHIPCIRAQRLPPENKPSNSRRNGSPIPFVVTHGRHKIGDQPLEELQSCFENVAHNAECYSVCRVTSNATLLCIIIVFLCLWNSSSET